jgi:hypothetical protein
MQVVQEWAQEIILRPFFYKNQHGPEGAAINENRVMPAALLASPRCALPYRLPAISSSRCQPDAKDRQHLTHDNQGAKTEENPDRQTATLLGPACRRQGKVIGADDKGSHADKPRQGMHEVRPGSALGNNWLQLRTLRRRGLSTTLVLLEGALDRQPEFSGFARSRLEGMVENPFLPELTGLRQADTFGHQDNLQLLVALFK